MAQDKTIANSGRCPTCGYVGRGEVCPFDGTALVKSSFMLPDTNQASRDADVDGQNLTSLAPTLAPVTPTLHTGLRKEDFGHWAEPEVIQKSKSLIGRSLGGRYTITSVLGRGGMGTVYAAHQASVDRSVAIKVLNREFAENPMIVRRFHQEAMAASRLTHPNTISVYDFGQSEGLLYIAMEHLRGETLKARLERNGHLPTVQALEILQQILKSVAEAHRQGVIHRDLKPENIFLAELEGEKDFVKVLDFGVAQLRTPDDDQATLTQVGSIFGTPKYMAPEQTMDVTIDARVDIYSLGIMLYEMLLGSAPFEGENPLAIILAHANQAIPRFSVKRPDLDIPSALEAIVLKALAKDRERRHSASSEFSTELDLFLSSIQESAAEVDTSSLPSIASVVDSPSVSDVEILPNERPTEHRGPMIQAREVLWGLAVLLGLIVLGLWTFSDSSTKTQDRTVSTPSDNPTVKRVPAVEVVGIGGRNRPAPAPIVDEFTIVTKPPGAIILNPKTGARLGKTPARFPLAEKTVVLAQLDGYRPTRWTIDPARGIYTFQKKLKPIPPVRRKVERKRKKPKNTAKTQPSTVVKPIITIKKNKVLDRPKAVERDTDNELD
jgi:serine/threonine protein kinase